MPSFTLGSLSTLVGHYVNGYECLAPWQVIQPNPATRDATEVVSEDRNYFDKFDSNKKANKDTKPFYDEESDQSEESSDESSSSDSSDSDSTNRLLRK